MVGCRRAVLVLVVVALAGASVALPPPVVAAGPQPRTFMRERAAGTAEPLAAATTPSGFADTTVFSGLAAPTAVRFSPDGRVFVAEKSGLIKVFSSISATTPTVFADLSAEVDDYWDRGLLGLALDPGFPTSPYVYVGYTYDAPIGGSAPTWNDACPTPPGPTTDGCVVSNRVSRLTVNGNVMSSERVLVNDWCQQFPSHSVGDLRFGPDGALYVSAGEGSNFDAVDYGQFGGTLAGTPTRKNPCGDPPAGVGGTESPPTAEGGSLRSQSVRRPSGEPVSLDGSIVRLDPATGAALGDNPLAGNANANAKRIVAFGFRNPFRFAFRPGTGDLWVGDVGQSTWEEIDRVVNPKGTPVANAGWPCYEGGNRMAAWDSANVNVCETLYGTPTGLLSAYFAYRHSATVVGGESCPTGSSSISGIAFHRAGGYPAAYDNALFFADHSRNCIWAMQAGSNGLPDPTRIVTFEAGAGNPVDLETGPGGDIWYVDHEGGKVRRLAYNATNNPPTAVISASATSGPTPLTVSFDGSRSTDPDAGDTLTYSWDLNGDGTFGDATLARASNTYATAGAYTVGLHVTDSHGATSAATVQVNVGNALPVPVIDGPASTLTWAVGDTIRFSGHATDGSGTAIPASALSWTVTLDHCPSNCHTHAIQSFAGVASGSFVAPDHDYPSYLVLTLTATDSAGHRASASVRLDPKTTTLTLQGSPSGVALVVGLDASKRTPFGTTVIQRSTQTVSAPSPQMLNGVKETFGHWSDGGSATHSLVVPAGGLTLAATYRGSLTTSWLSDLPRTVVRNGWGPVEKDMSNGEQAAGDGPAITLNGTVYAKGLGGHAASEVDVAMNGACTIFTSKVGVDDEVPASHGSVVFQVWGDGTKLADSGRMTGATATRSFTVDVTGRTKLRLVITDGGDGNAYDHGDWAAAKLTCGPVKAAWVSDLAWKQVRNGWGPVEKDTSNGGQAAGDGRPITLNGTVFTKGLGAHAASEVDVAMNGSCAMFRTKVGVDDEVGATHGSLVFQVWGDGTKLADSGLMTGATASKLFTVDVTGRTTLRLVITDGGNGISYDHGDWAAPKLTCAA
jgi:glucose/arabinose dehydrogenase